MRPRQSIVEIFSTFLKFDADRFSGWMTDPKLRRSMERSLTKVEPSETSESFWVFYWYKVWQSPPLSQARDIYSTTVARSHLAAYLQEICYWAAQKTVTANVHVQCQVSDCFQIAIAQIDKILKGYNPNQGFSLKNYASAIFGGVIRDNLRQRGEVEFSGYTLAEPHALHWLLHCTYCTALHYAAPRCTSKSWIDRQLAIQGSASGLVQDGGPHGKASWHAAAQGGPVRFVEAPDQVQLAVSS